MVIFNNETLKQAVKEWIDNPDTAKTKYGHISDWDVSKVTDMSYLFYRAESFNQNISNWDVSNVIDMMGTFRDASSFNQDLSAWNVDNVTVCSTFSYFPVTESVWSLPQPNFTNCDPD